MNDPRLTIGMPVFNNERFLDEAIASHVGQSFGDFRLIVADNGSTDQTRRIAQRWAARDKRVEYVRHSENRGVCWNFNYLAERARAPLFKWSAGDDVCQASFLERCVRVMDERPEVVCCHSYTEKIGEHGEPLGLPDPTLGGRSTRGVNASAEDPARRFADVLLHSGWSVRCYGVMRHSVLTQSRLIQPFYGSEKVMMSELALRGPFCDVPEALFQHRVHASASSNLQTAKQQQAFFDPTRKFANTRTRNLTGFLSAVRRAPLSPAQRLQCLAVIARYLLQWRKWSAVIGSACRGRGAGAAGGELTAAKRNVASSLAQETHP
ncbi:MAG: glycosyltransferase family 2 protein [Pirellulaceae bacterium]|jgi:hypothetical protein|nr:glycosyltransferase family 2 protein [Pirellulaceae bacterium]MDP7014787.1 glycosyltransferase family 2 protein [Pirellulaceae bacterium]